MKCEFCQTETESNRLVRTSEGFKQICVACWRASNLKPSRSTKRRESLRQLYFPFMREADGAVTPSASV
jgi:hypothetical protein